LAPTFAFLLRFDAAPGAKSSSTGNIVRSVITSILLVVGSIALALGLGEAGCRLAGYRGLELYQPDRQVGWVLQPNQTTVTRVGHFPVQVNGDGFRDDPLERPKPPNTVRIFALGGSTTFGWGVANGETYHQLLERMLNDSARVAGRPTRFEIVNAGVIGYNSWQVARLMGRIAERYEPDGFLVAYTFNDAWNPVGTLNPQERDRMLAGVRRKNLLRRSALFNWLIDFRAQRLARRAEHGALGDEFAVAQTGDSLATPAELAAYQATLDSMVALTQRTKLSLGFTVLAARGQQRPGARQAAMSAAAAAAHLPALDLTESFASANPDSMYLPNDAVHPSVYGHALIARLMYQNLCAALRAAPPHAPILVYGPGCGAG
jgi:lysophospholipase L1-like esterase